MADDDKPVNANPYDLGRLHATVDGIARDMRDGFGLINKTNQTLATEVHHHGTRLHGLEKRIEQTEAVASKGNITAEKAYQKARDSVHEFGEFKDVVTTHVDTFGKSINMVLEGQNKQLEQLVTRQEESRQKHEKRDSDVRGLLDAMKAKEVVERAQALAMAETERRREYAIKVVSVATPVVTALVSALAWALSYFLHK